MAHDIYFRIEILAVGIASREKEEEVGVGEKMVEVIGRRRKRRVMRCNGWS
jgi:hypothetical protein